MTGGREAMVSLEKDRSPPMELKKRRDICLDASCYFNGSEDSLIFDILKMRMYNLYQTSIPVINFLPFNSY
jgi:hypothetical protein